MEQKAEKNVSISIIVPVYNVYDWIDQCLESIVNQTFTDFEVLLINDGSTDKSDEKCRQWAFKDSRILYFSKRNEGLSATRNMGIREAKGEYLAFIDSDDWVERDFLWELIHIAKEEKADMAECDVCRYNDLTGNRSFRSCYGDMGIEYSKDEHMVYGNTAIWKCIIKRDLFKKYDINFPECHSPARAIYPLLVALSNKIVNTRKYLYYYRIFRQESLSDKPRTVLEDGMAIGCHAMEELIHNFKKCGISEICKEQLERTVKYKLSDLLAAFFHRKPISEFCKMVEDYRQLIKQNFPENQDKIYIILGGYNLNRITWYMNMLHNPYNRFNFSSLISIMHKVKNPPRFSHANKYREIMLDRDINSEFWEIIGLQNPSYIVLDFIEERFDIFCYQDGFITMSDAFNEADIDISDGTVILRNSEVCTKLWKQSCREFLDKIYSILPDIKIILVKNFLSEQIGDIEYKENYPEIDQIRRQNQILNDYYQFFEDNCQDAIVVEAAKDKFYYTDKDYEYGAIPSHLNNIMNRKIARKLEIYFK